MTGSELPTGISTAAMLSSMGHQGDPSARLLCALPSLGYTIGMPQGLMSPNLKWGPFCFFSAGQSGGKFGPLSGLGALIAPCFVPMSEIAGWCTNGLESVHASIDGIPIEGAHIEGTRIEGRSVLQDAPEVVAPRIAAHQHAVEVTMHMG